MTSSTSFLSQLSRGSKLSSSPRPSQENDQFLSALPKSEGSHHSTTAAGSESFLNVPRESQIIKYSSEVMPSNTLTHSSKSWTRSSTAQQNKSLNPVPPSSSFSPRTRLNPTLPDCDYDVISSPASLPSATSSQSQSEQSPRPPDSPSSRSRLASSLVNSRHSTSHSDPKLIPHSRRVIASTCTTLPSSPVHDSIKFPIMEIGSHTDGNNTPPPSRWLKGTRRSPQTATLSLQLSMSGQ